MTKRKETTPELGVIYKEALRNLAQRGPANYLELEARILRPALHTIMRALRSRGLALRFDGEGLQHAGEALDIYFDFLATLSRRQLSDAMTDALEYLQHRERERAATV